MMHLRPFQTKPVSLCMWRSALAFLLICLCLACLVRHDEELQTIQQPQSIDGIPKNLSGLTWNHETGTLFAVTNQPELLLEISPDGKLLRRVELVGFEDTEGITHLSGTHFAVVEERRGKISTFDLPPAATSVDHALTQRLVLGPSPGKNKGFESLSYDPASRTLSTMREGKPFICLVIALDEEYRPQSVRSVQFPKINLRDVASVVREPDGSLWVLSEASSAIVLLDKDGRERRRFTIRNAPRNFQPEGLTLCPDGRIFVVGEPDMLAVYKSKSP